MPASVSSRARVRAGVAAGLAVIAAALVGRLAGMSGSWVLVLAVLLAAGAAAGFAATGMLAAAPPPPSKPVAAEPSADEAARWRSLRHDLRGILSPGLLMADRLLMSTEDPLAKRTAEAMIEVIERAEKRLSGDPAPGAH